MPPLHSRIASAICFRLAALLLAGCCVWASGCGVEAYEQRLNNANEMFAYQNRLDRVLEKTPWAAPYGIETTMRVPKGFVPIPPPPPPAEGEEESAEPVVDPRQPTYLGINELEGLLGAWKASMPAADNQQSFVFLYVVSNHQRMLNSIPGEAGVPPEEYLQDLESLLQLQLGVTIGDGGQSGSQDNVKTREQFPRDQRAAKYARTKDFTFVRLVPSEGALEQLGLPDLDVYVYEHQAGPIQLALLLVAPRAIQGSPDSSLQVALETLQVSDQPPRRAAPDGSPAPRESSF